MALVRRRKRFNRESACCGQVDAKKREWVEGLAVKKRQGSKGTEWGDGGPGTGPGKGGGAGPKLPAYDARSRKKLATRLCQLIVDNTLVSC
jgi:hypothetical protein